MEVQKASVGRDHIEHDTPLEFTQIHWAEVQQPSVCRQDLSWEPLRAGSSLPSCLWPAADSDRWNCIEKLSVLRHVTVRAKRHKVGMGGRRLRAQVTPDTLTAADPSARRSPSGSLLAPTPPPRSRKCTPSSSRRCFPQPLRSTLPAATPALDQIGALLRGWEAATAGFRFW